MKNKILKKLLNRKLKELLSELKKFKVQTTLVIGYKKSTKLIATNSDIDKAFLYMHQSMIKNYFCEDWIVLDVTIKHSINIFE